MNEQLIVKNFGPIKDATVDFKRVTVFIGPTGGGKSTLAKLAAILRNEIYSILELGNQKERKSFLSDYNLTNYAQEESATYSINGEVIKGLDFKTEAIHSSLGNEINLLIQSSKDKAKLDNQEASKLIEEAKLIMRENLDKAMILLSEAENIIKNPVDSWIKNKTKEVAFVVSPYYIPSERIFVPAIEYSWAGLMRDDIGLPKTLLDFANSFSTSRKDISELHIPFFNVTYKHINGRDFIKIPEREELLMLLETASGIQSVTPMLVLLEHLSQHKNQAQSFIIEEPELNLYPTAQQGLLNWLVKKCTTGENDLTITTHSPYILSHLNLLLYAYQVAEKHPDRADDVAKVVPRESWINPKEFACYQVEGGGVQSLVDEVLGLIDNNELDALSGDAADAFDNLIRLSKSVATK